MWKSLEVLFDFYCVSLVTESKRFFKIQSWIFILETVKGLRNLFIFLMSIIFVTFAFAVSLFITFYYMIYLYKSFGYVQVDLFLVSNLIVLFFSFFILKFYNSEKRWLKLFKIDEKLNPLLSTTLLQTPESNSKLALSETDLKNLKELIDKSLESKLKEVLSRKDNNF
ncbi:MAG: hypothetical protein H6625_12235 [Bdellovibrionaceae bacterium]|nr:hypothetical protein [Pseudobdellovibrionaceae bacterium]